MENLHKQRKKKEEVGEVLLIKLVTTISIIIKKILEIFQ
jgi:hypothetical protein